MGSYWTNYHVPSTNSEIAITVEAWMSLLGKIPDAEVHTEIARQASEGREFAPNVGQIYAAIKERRVKALPKPKTKEQAEYEAYVQKYHKRGLPTLSEFIEQGHTTGEWLALTGGLK
jgi:hypothetical protein